jgi:hypothetical protein
MKFTQTQIDQLILRLRQTKEELLYDFEKNKVQRYAWMPVGGKILGVAHCDFVESAWSYPTMLDANTIQAGQVDDRVGVWLLLDILPNIKGMPKFDVLLTTDEEIGQSSAGEVDQDLTYNWTFQFDRRGTDFVDYNMSSSEFLDAFKNTTGIPYATGSFSDICSLPNGCGSRVNIGCGYYNEHNTDAWVDLEECAKQVDSFVLFAKKYVKKQFPVNPIVLMKTDPFLDFDEDDFLTESLSDLPADSDISSVKEWLATMANKRSDPDDEEDNPLWR